MLWYGEDCHACALKHPWSKSWPALLLYLLPVAECVHGPACLCLRAIWVSAANARLPVLGTFQSGCASCFVIYIAFRVFLSLLSVSRLRMCFDDLNTDRYLPGLVSASDSLRVHSFMSPHLNLHEHTSNPHLALGMAVHACKLESTWRQVCFQAQRLHMQ